MATPAIILRFRDTTPGIDTITAHTEMLRENGKVGWGWWKKASEAISTEEVRSRIYDKEQISLLLVDRSTERAFICTCIGFQEPATSDPGIAPKYYRTKVKDIGGLFLLTSINSTTYDSTIADQIGERTFMWSGETANPALGHRAPPTSALKRSRILHLSDLHFGGDYGFPTQGEKIQIGDVRRTLTDCIFSDLKRLKAEDDIAAIVVTGDFITKGVWNDDSRQSVLREFEVLRQKLNLNREQIIAVPGNHDVIRYAEDVKIDISENAVAKQINYEHETLFRKFADDLMGRDWRASLNYVQRIHLETVDLDVCILNSCTIAATKWTEYGYVGRNGIDTIQELRKLAIERPTYRFLALHHHLLPVANVEAPQSNGVTLTLDASDILSEAQRSHINVALHGHQHKPKVTLYQNVALNGGSTGQPIYVIANGSSGAVNSRLPPGERNTYCLLHLDDQQLNLTIRELRIDGEKGAELFQDRLATKPVMPTQ